MQLEKCVSIKISYFWTLSAKRNAIKSNNVLLRSITSAACKAAYSDKYKIHCHVFLGNIICTISKIKNTIWITIWTSWDVNYCDLGNGCSITKDSKANSLKFSELISLIVQIYRMEKVSTNDILVYWLGGMYMLFLRQACISNVWNIVDSGSGSEIEEQHKNDWTQGSSSSQLRCYSCQLKLEEPPDAYASWIIFKCQDILSAADEIIKQCK